MSCSHGLYWNLHRDYKNDDKELNLQYYYVEALKEQFFGNLNEACVIYQKILKADKSNSACCFQLSQIYLLMNKRKECFYYGRRASQIDAGNKWYDINMARIFMAFNCKDSAAMVFLKLNRKYPDNIEYEYNLASIYDDLNNNIGALNLYNDIENRFGNNEEIAIKKYKIYLKVNKLDSAEVTLINLINQNPEELRYLYILSDFYRSVRDENKAFNIYNRILKINKNDKNALIGKLDILLENKQYESSVSIIDTLLFNTLKNFNDKEEVIFELIGDKEVFRQLKNNLKEWIDSLENDYKNENRIHLIKAEYNLANNNSDESCNEFRSFTSKDKRNIVAWERVISVFFELKKFNEVIGFCDTAIQVFPKKAFLYLYKAYSFYNLNNFLETIETLEKGKTKFEIESNEEKSQILSILGESYYKLNNFKAAEKCFLSVLEFDKKNYNVLNNYAFYLSLRNEKLKKAKDMSWLTIEAQGENPVYLDTYAWILYKMKNYREARKYIEKAIKNGGFNNFEVVDHYADISFCNGDEETALKNWNLAIELGGDKLIIEKKIKNFKCGQ